ncbi:MAG: hypothetical protein LUE11_03080 [Clostridia bacterium]|nr:hypothetical protein [Clostridia bacterium]
MESADLFSSLLQDPETMQKIAGIASELMGNADHPQPPPAQAASHIPEQSDEWMNRILPVLSGIAHNGQKQHHPERRELLHALRPFLSSSTCAQIDHAEHILSMAQMVKTAAEQLLPQYSGQREV